MKKVISDEQLAALRRYIMQAERIVICAHVGPDGDAIGSSLAIKHWLARWGKQADVLVPNRFPDFLRWLTGVQDIRPQLLVALARAGAAGTGQPMPEGDV